MMRLDLDQPPKGIEEETRGGDTNCKSLNPTGESKIGHWEGRSWGNDVLAMIMP
jgi:hypothetical protein